MNLKELGTEYMQQYERLMERIAEIKKQYDSATPEIKRKSHIRIKELMTTATYLKKTAEKLIGYYDKKNKRRYWNEKKHPKP